MHARFSGRKLSFPSIPLFLLLLIAGLGLTQVWAGASSVQAVGPVGMTVSDLDRSVAFYTGVLDFEKVSEVEATGESYERLQGVFGLRMRIARLRLGGEEIELTEYLAPAGRAYPPDTRSNDRWFQHVAIIVSDMERAYQRLREHRVRHASTGPQRLPDWNPNAGGIEAFYFRDPDGHFLEILRFPAGKGDAKWQQAGSRLFLGIDHTAIVVADTEASLRFYRDVLGMRVAGTSENFGPEQERLNNVFGARLRITSLRAAEGPGIEFLEYLSPQGGRPAPVDLQANDLAHWQTRLVVSDAVEAVRRMREHAAVRFITPGLADVSEPLLGFSQGTLVRDPDGHGLQVVEAGPPVKVATAGR